MTITARTAHTSLAASATLLGHIAPRVAQGVGATISLIAVGGDRGEQRADAGIRSKGDINDPTATTALARIAAHEHHLEDIEQYLETIRRSVALIVAWCDDHAPIAVDHPRCTGGKVVEEWSRPDCTNYVAYSIRADGSFSYRGDGLCDRCRQAKAKHERMDAA